MPSQEEPVSYTYGAVSTRELMALFRDAGWAVPSPHAFRRALAGTFLMVVAKEGERTIGVGRAVSDGGLYGWIHDVIVVQDRRGRGIGTRICRMLMEGFENRGVPYIGLFAARGTAPFYERLGFVRRPTEAPGMYLFLAPEVQ